AHAEVVVGQQLGLRAPDEFHHHPFAGLHPLADERAKVLDAFVLRGKLTFLLLTALRNVHVRQLLHDSQHDIAALAITCFATVPHTVDQVLDPDSGLRVIEHHPLAPTRDHVDYEVFY